MTRKKTLPREPSKLIRLGLDALGAAEADGHIINLSLDVSDCLCEVTLSYSDHDAKQDYYALNMAGAVMLKVLKLTPNNTLNVFDPQEDETASRLRGLICLCDGYVQEATDWMFDYYGNSGWGTTEEDLAAGNRIAREFHFNRGSSVEQKDVRIIPYKRSPERFRADMVALADRFEKIGL
jgi:hypothetical protein